MPTGPSPVRNFRPVGTLSQAPAVLRSGRAMLARAAPVLDEGGPYRGDRTALDHRDDAVAGAQDRIAGRDQELARVAFDRNDHRVARQRQLADSLRLGGRVLGDGELDELELALAERRDRGEVAGVDLLVDDAEDDLGRRDRRDRIVGVDRLEDHLVFRIVDPRDTSRFRLLLGDQTNDEIVFVVSGIGDDDIRSRDSRLSEDDRIAAVAHDRYVGFEEVRHHLRFLRILLDDDDLMVFFEEGSRQVRSDLGAARVNIRPNSESASGATTALISSPFCRRSSAVGMSTFPARRIAGILMRRSRSISPTRFPLSFCVTVAVSERSFPKSNCGTVEYGDSIKRLRIVCAPTVVGQTVSIPNSRYI